MKKGIILAGGTGSRLLPLTQVVNKHLLPINGKFIIDYPLDTLKRMGIEDVTVILGGAHFSQIVGYLQDGSRYNMNFHYVYQKEPKGIAHAINLCKHMLSDESKFAVILGDNIFENRVILNNSSGAEIVLNKHSELNRFGVASLHNKKISKIEEKPKVIDHNYDNYAITGCYAFTSEYFEIFKKLKSSSRNEYEITDIINHYNNENDLSYTFVDGLWSDAGTHESIGYVNNYFYNKK